MKRKAIFSLLLALCLFFAMTVTAVAQVAEYPQGEGNLTDSPGSSVLTATASKDDDGIPEKWEIDQDDTNIEGRTILASDGVADIAVWAKIINIEEDYVYCVEIEWGAMKFAYGTSTAWNPATLSYGSGEGEWFVVDPTVDTNDDDYGYVYLVETGAANNNNRITVTNKSNNGIKADFAYSDTLHPTTFGTAVGAGEEPVRHGFYATGAAAKAAAALDAAGIGSADATWALTRSIFSLELDSADQGLEPNNVADSGEVYFAFSGTPSNTILARWQKVGIITVTITPDPVTP